MAATFIGSNSFQGSSTASAPTTLTVTAGNLLVAAVELNDSSNPVGTVTSVTVTGEANMTPIGTGVTGSLGGGSPVRVQLFWLMLTASGAKTITATASGTHAVCHIRAAEFGGIAATGTLDGHAEGFSTTGAPGAPAVVTTFNNDLGYAATYANSGAVVAGSGFTTDGGVMGAFVAYTNHQYSLDLGAAGSKTMGWGGFGITEETATAVAVFKITGATAGGGGTNQALLLMEA